MAQKIGTMGESYFNFLCASENINCNKSEEDMAGWDYILDFPLENTSSGSDTATGPIECKVQIKSTTKDRKFSAVKLSNLLRFCKSPLPTFFLFLEFGNKKAPQSLYLVHFDETLIEETLKKVRAAEQGKKKKKLHSSTMRISYDSAHKLAGVTGVELKKSIEGFILNGMSEYAKKKISFTESVGFESGSGVLKFTTTNEDSLSRMIAASLGYDDDIPVSDITINQKRFGIELATPLHKIDKGIIKISSPANHLNMIVKFREDKYSSPISFRAKAYIPPIPNLPQHLLRIRLKTAFFDLMIGFGDNTSTYQMSIGTEKHSVNDLLNQARLMQWMCFDKRDILLDVELEDKPELKVSLSIKQKTDALHSEIESWKGEVENIERAYWITTKFKLNDILRLSINDTYNSREKIENFYNIYHIALGDMRLTYGVDGEGYEPEVIKKHCATYVFHLWLGGVLIATILTIKGTPEKVSDSEYNLLVTERIIEKELVSFDDLDGFRQHLRDEVLAINKKNHDMGYIVLNRI